MARNSDNLQVPAPQAHGHRRRSVAVRRSLRQLARRRRPARRRGVILLVTLVLLTLFTMMLITYVISTFTSRKSVTSSARVEQTGDSPEALMNDAFLQAIRGPRNPNSPLGAHSLLEDEYGSDAMTLNIPTTTITPVVSGGNPATPIFQVAWTYDPVVNPYPRVTQLPPPTGHYAGRTVMVLNGPNTGAMGRVIGSEFDGATHSLTLYGLSLAQLTVSPPLPAGTPLRLLVNGKPFSGTGFGFKPLSFDPTATNAATTYTRLLDAYVTMTDGASWTLNMQQALLPNHRQNVFQGMIDPNDPTSGQYSQYADPAGPGGANEDYDAADFQNMALSMSAMDRDSMETILPSFHRPDLIQYWATQVANVTGGGTTRTLLPPANSSGSPFPDPLSLRILRKIVLRPLPWDHPNFTGSNAVMAASNPNLALATYANPLISGPWDIDNDLDGETDSVWLDVGLPVQTAPDGRRYKPLVAYLIRDLDGRLNLNAHSSWRHAPSATATLSRFLPVQVPFAVPPGQTTQPSPYRLRVGQGYGPAEISLSPIFAPYPAGTENVTTPPYSVNYSGLYDANGLTEMGKILGGDPNQNLDGRYGEVQLTGNNSPGGLGGGSTTPGISALEDPFSWLMRSQHPQLQPAPLSPQTPYRYLPTTTSNGVTAGGFTVDSSQFGAALPDGTLAWTAASGYGSPPDLDGDGMLTLDLRGRPLYIDFTVLPVPSPNNPAGEAAGWGEPNDTFDNQYEVDLSLTGRGGAYNALTWNAYPYFTPNLLTAPYTALVDAPFTPSELERVMRAGDIDATTLPDRLMRLAPATLTNGNRQQQSRIAQALTTDQYDMAVPAMPLAAYDMSIQITSPPNKALNTSAVPPVADNSIMSLVRARLLNENPMLYTVPLSPGSTQAMNSAIKLLLPPDLLMGQKFDINRLLGNGRDDNGNGVVDEPGEYEALWQELYGAPGIQLDLNNDGMLDGTNPQNNTYGDVNIDGIFDARDIPPFVDLDGNNMLTASAQGVYNTGEVPGTLPRQLLARHLYVLMMLLKDPNFIVNVDLDGNGVTGNNTFPNPPPGFIGVASDADTAYYIAQLAVNMVDFRDRDAAMTPFKFDIYPFRDDDGNLANGTWDVDGFIAGVAQDGTTQISPDDNQLWRRGLVWGCERPELIITETMATHDRRTRDTNQDTTTKVVGRTTGDDANFDQVRRPLAMVAVELFNPNTPLTTGNMFAGEAPNELYASVPGMKDAAGNPLFGVNLSKLTPPNAAGKISPVWRLATQRSNYTFPVNFKSPRLASLPFAALDRVVYFVLLDLQAGNANLFESGPQVRAFSGQPGGLYGAFVAPGTYALVAPAALNAYGTNPGGLMVTPLGMRDTTQDSPAPYVNNPTATPPTAIVDSYSRVLVLQNNANPAGIGVCDSNYNLLVGAGNAKPTVGVWVGPVYLTNTGGVLNNYGPTAIRSVRFSLTEPDNGYPLGQPLAPPLITPNPAPAAADMYKYVENGYYDYTQAKYPNRPYDDNSATFNNGAYDGSRQLLINAAPYATLTAVTTIYLQRLADPLHAWDSVANPYITVDQMPVDLSVFNSEMQTAATPSPSNAEFVDATNTNIDPATQSAWKFDTRRRSATGSPTPNVNNVWYQGSVAPGQAPGPPKTLWTDMLVGGQTFMTRGSLGYLNNEYGVNGNSRWTSTYLAPTTFGGQPSIPATAATEYVGDPTIPFPWLNWNNRPYVSGKELMMVPCGSPASLLRETTLSQTGQMGNQGGAFEPVLTVNPLLLPGAEFMHLANPFHSAHLTPTPNASANAGPMTPNNAGPNLFRLLDLVHVPSRYTGTVDWIPPNNVSGASSAPHYLHPPFNQVSRFRDPGKVNINTIYDPLVCQGILDERFPGESSPAWLNMYQSVWASRQGSGITNGAQSIFGSTSPAFPTRNSLFTAAAVANMPTIFAKPFRSAAGNSLVPLAQMRFGHAGSDLNEREVSSTLFRPDPTVPAFPMLEAPGAPPPVSGFFKEYVNPPFANPQANPYFAYEEIRRLDNLVTTRSNVYAIWITVGYFEVTPATNTTDPDYAAMYPDGWQLGAELGSDTGDVQRHRAFYMYDRSIPVGFERGENHNVDRGILVQRYIE